MIIENAKPEHLDSIVKIARDSGPYMVPNTRMMYYLCCTVFSKYSFVAIKEDPLEQGIRNVVGYLFAFPDSGSHFVWIHQLSVAHPEQNGIAAALLLRGLEKTLIEENTIRAVRFAIRKDNRPSYSMAVNQLRNSFQGISYRSKSLGVEKLISEPGNYDMEIFEVNF